MAQYHGPLGTYGTWTWCLHCERIYPTRKWVENKWHCPAPDHCDGGALDAHDFAKKTDWPREGYREQDVEHLLGTPVEGAWYPLYLPEDPVELAKIGKPGRWGRRDGKPLFIVQE